MDKQIFNKSNWKKVTFGEVSREVRDAEKAPLRNGIDRYVGLEHIESEDLHIRTWGDVAEGTTFTRKFKKGQLLFGRRRAYLRKAAVADFDGICSGDILVFEANQEKVLPEFFPFIIQNDQFFNFAVDESAGSLSPRVKYRDLSEYEFLLPPLAEQKKLADLLWAGDNVLQRYRELEQQLKIDFQTTLNNEISRSLQSNKIKNRIKIIKGVTYKSTDYTDEGEGNLLINLKCFEKYGGFNREGIKYFRGKNKPEHIVTQGDLVIALTDITREGAVVGFPVFVPEDMDGAVITMDVAKLRIEDENIDTKYLYYLLRTHWAHWHMYSHASGTTVLHLDLKAIPKLRMPNISLIEQKQVVEKLTQIENTIDGVEKILGKVEPINKSLINQIFG